MLESWEKPSTNEILAIEPMNIFKLGKSQRDNDEYGRKWVNTKGLGTILGKIMNPSRIFLNDSDIFINVPVRSVCEVQNVILSKKFQTRKKHFLYILRKNT